MTNRPPIQSTIPLAKCAGRHSLDHSLSETVSHPTVTSQITKQTASGDTGDNGHMCDQTKRSLAEEPVANPQTSKSGYNTTSSDNCSIATTNSSKQSLSTNTPKYDSSESTTPVSSPPENKTNLIINYLPPNMSQEEVRALFSSIGEVESCKLVREKTSGESLGYAFVKFYNASDAGKAIKTLNGLRLQNKTVKVSLARPSSEAIKGANLYICGLPRKMTQPELEKLFSTCGHIITARILYDTKTGLSRGVAFIRYDQRTEAEVAIRKLNGYVPASASDPITVKFANSPSSNRVDNLNLCSMRSTDCDTNGKYIPNNCGVSLNGPMGMSPGIDGFSNSVCRPQSNIQQGLLGNTSTHQRPYTANRIMTSNTVDRQTPTSTAQAPNQQSQQQQQQTYPGRNPNHSSCSSSCQNACSYGNNLDNGTNSQSVSSNHCFTSQPLSNTFPTPLNSNTATSASNIRSDMGLSSSLQRLAGAARFKCHAAAMAAAAISGGTGVGLRSPTGLLNGQMGQNFPTVLPNFGMDLMRGLGPGAHTLLAPAFAASSGALTATGWCIFVYNLSPDTEESILWQLFGPFGAVQTVKVIRDPVTSKCKGFGFVTMSNYEEALLAIHSLNGFNLGNRVLQVSFKTTPNSRQMKYMANVPPEMVMPTGFGGTLTPVPGAFRKPG